MILVFLLKKYVGFGLVWFSLIILMQNSGNTLSISMGLDRLECLILGWGTKPYHLFCSDFYLAIMAHSNTSTLVKNPCTHNSHNYTGITCLRSKIV